MLINSRVPDFSLPDLDGNIHRLGDFRGKIAIVNFWSAECPWSERADQHLTVLSRRLPEQVAVLPVASNVNEADVLINETARQRGIPFILRDAGRGLADAWQAQTTPHVFVIDRSGVLRYQGAVDDVTFRKRTPTRSYVAEAVEALLGGRLPETQETTVYGCAIVRFP